MSDIILGIQNSLLSGQCTDDVLSKLSDIHLEKLLARLANILSKIQNASNEELCKYCSWSKEKLKSNVVSESPKKKTISPKYNQFLQSAIRIFSQFCMPPPPTQMNYKRKRKCVAEIPTPHNFNKVAYVKVCDIIYQKKYFMKAMNLVPSTVAVPETKSDNAPQFNETYKATIPFSSEVGQKYMKIDKYQMTDYLHNRKRKYTDEFLNRNISNTSRTKEYEVTFNKDKECTHMYNFPKRNMRHNDKYLNCLIAANCKPVSVSLIRMDLSGFGKKCVVSVERMDISKYLNKKS